VNRALWWLTVPVFLVSQYSPQVMSGVASYRESNGLHLHDTDGYVAVVEHEFLGDILWLRPLSGNCESFQVVDWSSPYMKRPDGMTGGEWMTKHQIGVEVDAETAKRWGTVGELAYATSCQEAGLSK